MQWRGVVAWINCRDDHSAKKKKKKNREKQKKDKTKEKKNKEASTPANLDNVLPFCLMFVTTHAHRLDVCLQAEVPRARLGPVRSEERRGSVIRRQTLGWLGGGRVGVGVWSGFVYPLSRFFIEKSQIHFLTVPRGCVGALDNWISLDCPYPFFPTWLLKSILW